MAMTKDDIIRMAERAGMERCKCEPRCHLHTGGMGSLTYFAKLVAEAEREACAKLLERTDLSGLKNAPDIQVFLAAILNAHVKAIRARGQS